MSAKGHVVRGKDKRGNVVTGDGIETTAAAVGAQRTLIAAGCHDVVIFGVAEDGTEERLPSYEEALAEIAAAHNALDPVVARRDAMVDPPLSLAVRCATAAKIALERFCAEPIVALEAAERRLLEDGGWREIGPDRWERDSKYSGLSRSNRATALKIEKRRAVDKAKTATGGTP